MEVSDSAFSEKRSQYAADNLAADAAADGPGGAFYHGHADTLTLTPAGVLFSSILPLHFLPFHFLPVPILGNFCGLGSLLEHFIG
jgi:hypothetical protein